MYDKLFIFSVLMFSVFAVPIIANKTKIPSIVFYILFGVILERFVFTLSSLGESFYIFSEVGKLYLMFIAGVEIDIFFFKKNVTKSAIFGVLSFIIPQVVGTIVIVSIFGYTMNAGLLIASLFASHTLLSLAIINKFGIGNSEPISVAVGATIVSDIAALALLAVIADLARGMDIPLHYWALLFGSWVLFICGILFVIPKIARRVFHVFSEDGYAQFLFVFATACFLSWLAHHLRLESLIGAFFCGLALCKIIPKHSILMTKINFVGNSFFIPFFFISAGMLINPGNLGEFIDALALGGILTLLGIVTKTVAGFIYGKFFKYSTNAIMMISGMTIQQAATTIVIAVVGLEVGILNETLFNAAMILILLSCSIGEVISVHYAGKYAQNLPKKSGGSNPFESKTLVFVPNIAACSNLLDFACLFRHNAKKYVISPLALATDNRESAADAETLLGVCMNHAHELEEVYQPEMRIANNAIDGILRTAAETRAGMVVCPFESHSPTLIDECLSRLVFTRMTKNISATNRILAVFMPTSEERSDLPLFIAEIKHLAQQVSAKIVFYLSDNQADKINAKIDKNLKHSSEYEIVRKNHWNAIKRDLPGDIHANDTVIISMGTRQTLFRLPSADKYPFHLAGRFIENCIFAAYPPLSVAGSNDDYGLHSESQQQGVSEYPKLEAVEATECDFRAITTPIAEKIGTDVDEIYGTLLSSLELYPVELVPGAVLVHAHTESVAVPRVFIWHQKDGNTIAPAKISPKVLVIVLNPLHGDPQIHLKTLSRIAGIFMNPMAGMSIDNCGSSAELIKKLQEFDDTAAKP
ncbi:MAG: cation:proton antiporter [Chitinispirillia bacterium]|nr:cation:proton antiporter [Chitinispirillia bacterium]MCL2269111.1 cation:proton antiporter [Chitinispirillia bacterium]